MKTIIADTMLSDFTNSAMKEIETACHNRAMWLAEYAEAAKETGNMDYSETEYMADSKKFKAVANAIAALLSN